VQSPFLNNQAKALFIFFLDPDDFMALFLDADGDAPHGFSRGERDLELLSGFHFLQFHLRADKGHGAHLAGEIQGGVLPPGDSGALGVADPGRRPTRFYVTNLTPQDAADLSAWLGPRGFRPTNKEPFIAVRFEGRTNLTIVLMAGWALLAALAMLVDDRRWRRRLAAGSGRPDARAWWRRWSLLMILAIGVLVLAVGVALIGQWVSMWTVALWMLASAALGLLGVAGLATGAALAIVRWRQGTGAQATPGWS